MKNNFLIIFAWTISLFSFVGIAVFTKDCCIEGAFVSGAIGLLAFLISAFIGSNIYNVLSKKNKQLYFQNNVDITYSIKGCFLFLVLGIPIEKYLISSSNDLLYSVGNIMNIVLIIKIFKVLLRRRNHKLARFKRKVSRRRNK